MSVPMVSWLFHVVPAGEEHTTSGLDCWCCPVWSDTDAENLRPLTREEADAVCASGEHVVVTHRSEVPGANDVTGPVPWQPWTR